MRVFTSALFLFFFFTISLSAQIAVKSFRVLPNDLDARTYHPVKDQNGDKCALIKVVSTETGFDWEGGSLGITKVVKKTGEFWVYVPYGSKRITIKHGQLGVLRNYIYPEAINEATVYEMVLTTGTVVTSIVAPQIKSQWVVVTTNPTSADIYIDDKHCGQTPFQQEFKEGKHTFRISKDLHHTEAGQFELNSEDGKKTMDFNLKPNFGFVNITSSPENGAKIYIDDVTINKVTPAKSDRIKSGKHTLLLTHKWYDDTQKEIEVNDGQTTEVIVAMNPRFAEVVINANADAEIFIDGKLEGNGSISKRLIAGTYTLGIKKPMYHEVTEDIEVKAGEPLSKQYELLPAFGGISIQTTPENGAEVSVDGTPSGKTTPCTLDQLPSGEYLITLRSEWYEPKKFRIAVEDGKSQTISQELVPTFVVATITATHEADIYVDNQKVGNGTYTGRINAGIHTFEARKDKHKPDLKKEEIVLGKEYSIALFPAPQYGALRVVSNPYDATIELNGNESGTTPKTFDKLLVGDYTIKLTKSGYASLTKTIIIEEGVTDSMNVELLSGKQVTINSTPQGAKLYIDNELKGSTPFTTELSFKKHNFKLTQDEYEDLIQAIEITEVIKPINLTLKRKIKGVPEMVLVKGGCFMMGGKESKFQKPIHEVCVGNFFIGKYEVTQKQWKEITGNNPSKFQCDNCPVERISWNDIQDYIAKLNAKTGQTFRLPTEAEWEYAARGGNQSSGYKYSGSNNVDDVAWYSDNAGSRTHKVGTKKDNELGIFNMSGNVMELCADWWAEDYYRRSPKNSPTGPNTGSYRVYRGGSWSATIKGCRVWFRYRTEPDYKYSGIGFRLARSSE